MSGVGCLKAGAIGLACLGMLIPAPVLNAAVSGADPVPGQMKSAADVELDGRGNLQGMVVDVDGSPVAHAVVVLAQGDRELARAETDGLGRFVVGPLRGGTYQLRVGRQERLVRLWAAETAPPAAKQLVLIVVGGQLVRGQLPLERFFASDTIVIMGLAAAMIAIPIAVHNSGGPASPP